MKLFGTDYSMNSANSYFEKKIFALGRYFWNLSVIVGAVSLGAGGILYLTSFPQKILKVNEWGWQTETLSGSYPEYKNKVEIKNYKKSITRIDSQRYAGGGLGLILLGSSLSVMYSIERNTRKA